MTRRVTLVLGLPLLLLIGAGLLPGPARSDPAAAAPERVVYLGGGLSDEALITLTANVAASGKPAVVLLDGPKSGPQLKHFLAAYQPDRVVPVGTFAEPLPDLERRLGSKPADVLPWKRGPPAALWKELFPQAERVVVCPAASRGLLLHAACLAGALGAPLYVTHDDTTADELAHAFADWRTQEAFAVGSALALCRRLPEVKVVKVADESAAAAACLRQQLKQGPVNTFVVANPADTSDGRGGMSALAPYIAQQRHAALLLTNPAGDNVSAVVYGAQRNARLARADTLLLVAGLKAIPPEHRPNPVPGKDPTIEMEPLTPRGDDPFTFATGRLFHRDDPGVVLLMLARQRLLAQASGPRKALVVSNPGGGLPLLETFSRNTSKELANAGYRTTALFEDKATPDLVRRLLPQHDVFLWEGHHKTMVEDFGVPAWTEPLPPALVFLQSCLALNEPEALPLLERGGVAVVGSATRTYSASGGAFTLAFFDALAYDDDTLGGALRQAKNFLLCYSLLKEKRLGEEAKLTGANVRSSWAFTLWGDPTVKLPRPRPAADALPAVRRHIDGNRITLELPSKRYDKVTVGSYRSEMLPNARLAGLLTQQDGEDEKRLVPFVYAEVHLPKAPADKTPRLTSRLPSRQWVFTWDAPRRCGYLLAIPRTRDQEEISFVVKWED